jgi:hypothetical protein
MMLCLIKRADGGVSIAFFADPRPAEPIEGEEAPPVITPEEVMQKNFERWRSSAKPEWLPATIEAFNGVVPPDKAFRNAWEASGSEVAVNMAKARALHRDRLRAARKPLLEELDIEYQRADEANDAVEKKAIARRKKALRDVTADPAIDAATTPAELAAVWPGALVK